MQSKTEKNAEKIHTEWEPWEKKNYYYIINIYFCCEKLLALV